MTPMPGTKKLILTNKHQSKLNCIFPPDAIILTFNNYYKYIIEPGDNLYTQLKKLKINQSIHALFTEDRCSMGTFLNNLTIQTNSKGGFLTT